MREADRLSTYLAELDRNGWTLAEYVAAHPDLSADILCGIRAAGRVRAASRPMVSASFRARSRSHLVTYIQQDALRETPRSLWRRSLVVARRILRPLLVPVTAALLLLSGGVGLWSASSGALPQSPLYSAKLAFEQVDLLTAFTAQQQIAVHLSIAGERLREANAEVRNGDRASVDQLLRAFDREVAQVQYIVRLPGNVVRLDLQNFAERQVALLQSGRMSLSGPPVAAVDGNRVTAVVVAPPPSVVEPTDVTQVAATDPSKLQVGPTGLLVADAANDRLNRAIAAATTGAFRVSLSGSLTKVQVVAPPAAPAPNVTTSSPGRLRPVPAVTPVPSAPATVSPEPVVVTPVPVVPTPVPANGGPPTGGVSPNPPPSQSPPSLPSPIGNPTIPVPIIVHNPTRLPSPALTGHKPVVSPTKVTPTSR